MKKGTQLVKSVSRFEFLFSFFLCFVEALCVLCFLVFENTKINRLGWLSSSFSSLFLDLKWVCVVLSLERFKLLLDFSKSPFNLCVF